MRAFAAELAVNLEPVYAIVLAIVLLGEQRELTPLFHTRVAIILAALLHPLLGKPSHCGTRRFWARRRRKGWRNNACTGL